MIEHVIQHIMATPGEWELYDGHALRRFDVIELCSIDPLSSMGYRYRVDSLRPWEKAILDAADGVRGHDPELRARMLEAADLRGDRQ